MGNGTPKTENITKLLHILEYEHPTRSYTLHNLKKIYSPCRLFCDKATIEIINLLKKFWSYCMAVLITGGPALYISETIVWWGWDMNSQKEDFFDCVII